MAINYFYHPLGDYAPNLVPGEASWSAVPHTRTSHGLSKMDIGCGSDHTVYSMTNGTLATVGRRTSIGEEGYIVVIKTDETGYSSMVASVLGKDVSECPLYFSYLELKSLKGSVAEALGIEDGYEYNSKDGDITKHPNISITKGQEIGVTNSWYDGSNVHIDIGGHDRYNGPVFLGNIRMGYSDYYLSDDIDITPYLADGFSITEEGNIIDLQNNILGVRSGNIYYPPGSVGQAITSISSGQSSDSDTRVRRYYEYCILCQKPLYINSSETTSSGTYSKDVDINEEEQDESQVQAALGVVLKEVGTENQYGDSSSFYPYIELVCRCIRNRVLNGNNIWYTVRDWVSGVQKSENEQHDYDMDDCISLYNDASNSLKNFMRSILFGYDYYYIENIFEYDANSNYGTAEYLYQATGFSTQKQKNYHIGSFSGTNGTVHVKWK